MEQSTKSNMRNAACLIGVFILGLVLADASHADKIASPRPEIDYQIAIDNDSMYVYDGSRLVGATAWSPEEEQNHDGVEYLIISDNY